MTEHSYLFGFSALLNRKDFSYNIEGRKGKSSITDNYICHHCFVSKFEDDKIYYEDDNYMILLDGVILNKKDLLRSDGNWPQSLIDLYEESSKREFFFNALKGSYGGVFYDKQLKKYIVFSDHIGSKFIYFVHVNDSLFVSTMMSECYSFMRQNGISYDISTENAYLLLSYGYMIDKRTLCEEISKIKPGYYLVFQNGKIEDKQFYLLDNTPDLSLTEMDFIELMDENFRNAVKQQFEKDKEYGYKHLVALSAGLDSRMTCWVAHELGYKDQLNFTFSQSNYYDETIPKSIAADLMHEWIFKALDNGLWLYNNEEITRLTGGNVLYYGLSHAYSLYSKMNFEDYGMIHSGQLGDVVFGTFYDSLDITTKFKIGDGAYSKTLLNKIEGIQYSDYKNQEISKFYFRGFAGANNGNIAEYAFTESFSPFYNLDLLRFALSIPAEYRYGHRIYKKWIINKYPQAAGYIWEKIGCKITRKGGLIKRGQRYIKIEDLPILAFRKLLSSAQNDRRNMNPLSYYLQHNKDLSNYMLSYSQYLDGIKDMELRKDVNQLLLSTSGVERIQAISLLTAIKLFYT